MKKIREFGFVFDEESEESVVFRNNTFKNNRKSVRRGMWWLGAMLIGIIGLSYLLSSLLS